VSAPIEVLFRNLSPSSGGSDGETIEAAKQRAPRQAATLQAAVSGPDYAELAEGFSHQVFGSVLKAVAAVRTSLNANIVELYILADGEELPVKPSAGLKKGIETYFDDINVITDQVRALDGEIKRVRLTANVVVSNSADASIVKANVESAITSFFSVDNFAMGQELYLSDIYAAINAVDGVRFTSIFEPTDDILSTGQLANPNEHGVGMNELIVLGEQQLRLYLEP
jgi:phage-related baseplate assembly protein